MICSSLNRDPFIVRPLPGGRTLLKSGGGSGAQVTAYSLLNRIMLVSSSPVVAAANAVMRSLIEGYFRRNLTMEEIRDLVLQGNHSVGNPLNEFSVACRAELDALQRGT